jgi:hypothetical protein
LSPGGLFVELLRVAAGRCCRCMAVGYVAAIDPRRNGPRSPLGRGRPRIQADSAGPKHPTGARRGGAKWADGAGGSARRFLRGGPTRSAGPTLCRLGDMIPTPQSRQGAGAQPHDRDHIQPSGQTAHKGEGGFLSRPFRERGEVHHVGEENSDLPAFSFHVHPPRVKKPEVSSFFDAPTTLAIARCSSCRRSRGIAARQ